MLSENVLYQWSCDYGCLTLTDRQVIETNGGVTVWTHEEFLEKISSEVGVLSSLMVRVYGKSVLSDLFERLIVIKNS